MNKLGMWFLISMTSFFLFVFALYSAFRIGQGSRDSSSGIKPDNDRVVAVETTMDVVKPTKVKTESSQRLAGPETETNIVYSEKDKGKEINGVIEFRGVKTSLKFE